MNYYCEHNICPMTSRLPSKTDTIVVDRQLHLRQVADVMGLDIEMLRSLNPEYRRDVVPGNTSPSAVRLPASDVGRFIDLKDSIFNYNAAELLSKRQSVEINDDVPIYVSKKKRTHRSTRRYATRRRRR
jgi:membrane-bound lytic murein transglycosylase D